MRISGLKSIRKEFDFRSAGRWLLLGSVVGVISGLCAILFQTLLVLVKEFAVNHLMGLEPVVPGGEQGAMHFVTGKFNPIWIVIIPAVGGLLAGLIIYRFAPEAEGHGTDEAIKAFHKKRGIIRPAVPIVKLLASVLTIGTGGSGGREGPIAQIGAGFGSFLATRMKMNTKTRRWLLAAGMGAGIGSIFRAPLAGAIFAAEVLYCSEEVETEVILPAAVSSIIAYSVYSLRYGWEHILTSTGYRGFDNPMELLPYAIEAFLLAFAAFLFVKTFYGVRKLFSNWNIPRYLKPFIGGLITGSMVFLLITVTGDRKYVIDIMGSGYGILQAILQDGIAQIGIGILLVTALGKILATSFTIGSGGSAGVFGPSMVIGGTLGAASGYLLQFIFPTLELHPSTFAVVGMAGFFSAAANTPLSTIIMVSELTGNYELLMPSMWVCTLSFLLARRWSIYQSQVLGKHESQAHFGEYAYDILGSITVREAYSKNRKFGSVPEDMSLRDILVKFRNTSQRLFPVVGRDGRLIGTLNIEDVARMPDKEIISDIKAKDVMHKKMLKVSPNETIDDTQHIMIANHVGEMIVVDDYEDSGKILGMIAASDIFRAYNRKLNIMRWGSDKPEALPSDKSLLRQLNISQIIEKALPTIEPEASLGDLVQVFIRSKRNIFPVVDHNKKYFGIILLNDIRELMFDTDRYDKVLVKDIMTMSPAVVNIDDRMEQVMNKFEKTRAWNLPVVDKHNRYVGILSQSSIFAFYRGSLLSQYEL
ncbi:MAG: chloride channel protein [Bacteroidales bacterium]|nr:chloride channel protein [Bacteroidales bacterium]